MKPSGKTALRKYIHFPHYWVRITPPGGFGSYAQRRDWLLVLNSRNIPCRICRCGNQDHLVVPALLENMACTEIHAYYHENSLAVKKSKFPAHPWAWLAILFPLPLILWYAMRHNGFPIHPVFLPDPSTWLSRGMLDSVMVTTFHQFYRLVTALTLHADASHLCGNIFFASVFIFILARFTGPGRALLLSLAGGIAGNAISLFFHETPYTSIGFSTSLFACIGIIGGIMARSAGERRHGLLAAGATIGLLALLGANGGNTDYAAHIAGLFSGFVIGLLVMPALRKKWSASKDMLALCLAAFLPIAAWWLAFVMPG